MPAGSDTCEAVHAELNALIGCHDSSQIDTCYVNVFPCNNCMKTLMNTGCRRIVYLNGHEQLEAVLTKWSVGGRTAEKLSI